MLDPVVLALAAGLTAMPAPVSQDPPEVPQAPIVAVDIEAFKAVSDEFAEARSEFMKAYQAAEDDETRKVMAQNYPRPDAYFDRMKEVATTFPGTKGAEQASAWVVQQSYGQPGTEWALDTLMSDHFDSASMQTVAQVLGRQMTADAEKHLDRLIADSPHRLVRGHAAYNRGSQMMQLGKLAEAFAAPGKSDDPYVAYYSEQMSAERRAALADPAIAKKYFADGEALLKRVAAEYDDITLYGTKTLAGAAEGDLFEIKNLAIGMVAPDIEGVDADGVSFKLTDYRGKVVVIDFWGFW